MKINKLLYLVIIFVIILVIYIIFKYNQFQYCKFPNNIIAQKKPFYVSIIKNNKDLLLIQKLSKSNSIKIEDTNRAQVGDYIIKGDNFYYILNNDDKWQYDFKILRNNVQKTANNFFTKDAIANRKPLPMYLINTQKQADYIKTNCTNIYNYKQASAGGLISNNNPNYTNLIPAKFVKDNYTLINAK